MDPFLHKLCRVDGLVPHRIGVMAAPPGGEALEPAVRRLASAGVDTVLCLVEDHEVEALELEAAPEVCRLHGIRHLRFPIADHDIPHDVAGLRDLLVSLAGHVAGGGYVAIHCWAGIGRTGTVAACLAHHLGVAPDWALDALSVARGYQVPQTAAQEHFVREYAKRIDPLR